MKSNLLIAAVVTTLSTGAWASDFQVLDKFRIGGEGAWDYLTYDPVGQRLFISRASHVLVVNPKNGKLVGQIADTPGAHGIALANDLGKGYVSNGRANSVTVFSTADLHTIAKLPSGGENPDYIAYDQATTQVVVFNGKSRSASVIDAAVDRLVATVLLSGKPEAAASDGAGRMFVNIEDRNEIAVIDLKQHAVTANWPLAGCEEPSGLAIDREHHRLFAGCHNETMLVIDSTNGQAVASLPIGKGVDANTFDPGAMLAFSSQGDGSLTVVQEQAPDRFSVLQNLATQEGARTMALDVEHHRVFLVTADFELATPASTGDRRRGKVKPGSFTLLVVGEAK
jgi:DNA-binding beta-propeller fold protein YncE